MKLSFPPRESRVIDLTLPVNPRTPSPIQPGVETRTLRRHGSNDTSGFPHQVMWFGMNDHCGTHLDAPLHFIANGKSISDIDIAPLCFMPGICLDFSPCALHQVLDVETVCQSLDKARMKSDIRDVPPGAFIMLHTGHDRHISTHAYFSPPYLTPGAAQLLTCLNPRAIGVNAPTVDDSRVPERPIHMQLLGQDIAIIEGVTNSAQLIGTQFMCSALPLKLTGFTGSPIRLVAFVNH